MGSTRDDKEFRQRIGRIEGLLREVERFKDPGARAHTREIVQAILDLHGAGLAKILDHLADAGGTGLAALDALARDELVGSLLLLHGLHPLDVEARVRQALDQVRPSLRSHGRDVELLGLADGVVRLRMQGSGHGCPSSAQTLKRAVEEAVYERAPDVTAIEVEGVEEPEALGSSTFVPVEELLGRSGR
jgi:Fe-S cluster biogenesis protein NfuA